MKKPLNLTGHVINQMSATTTRYEQLSGKVVPSEAEKQPKKLQQSGISGGLSASDLKVPSEFWPSFGRDNHPSPLHHHYGPSRHDRAPYPSALQAIQAGNKAVDITCLNTDDVTSEPYQRLKAAMDLSEDFKYIINRALGLAHPNAEAAKECMEALSALKQWDSGYGHNPAFANRRFKERAHNLAMAMVDTGIGGTMARFHLNAKPAKVDPYEKIGFMKLAGQGVFERAPDLTWLVLAAERCLRPKEVFNRLVGAWLFEVTAEIEKDVPGAAVKRSDVIGELAKFGLCQEVIMPYISAPPKKPYSMKIHTFPEFAGLVEGKERKLPDEVDTSHYMPPYALENSAIMQPEDLSNKVVGWSDITRDMDIDVEPMDMPHASMFKVAPYVPPSDMPAMPESRVPEAVAKVESHYNRIRGVRQLDPCVREMQEELTLPYTPPKPRQSDLDPVVQMWLTMRNQGKVGVDTVMVDGQKVTTIWQKNDDGSTISSVIPENGNGREISLGGNPVRVNVFRNDAGDITATTVTPLQ